MATRLSDRLGDGPTNLCTWNTHTHRLTHQYVTVCQHLQQTPYDFCTQTIPRPFWSISLLAVPVAGGDSATPLWTAIPCASCIHKPWPQPWLNQLWAETIHQGASPARDSEVGHGRSPKQQSWKERHFPERGSQRKLFILILFFDHPPNISHSKQGQIPPVAGTL